MTDLHSDVTDGQVPAADGGERAAFRRRAPGRRGAPARAAAPMNTAGLSRPDKPSGTSPDPAPPVSARIAARPAGTPARLSYAQERLFAADRILGAVGSYNQAQAFLLTGPLDRAALDRAVVGVQERHDILRTAVDVGVQGIALRPVTARGVEWVATTSADDTDPDPVRGFVEAQVGRPLHLATDGPFRVVAAAFDADRHVLVVSVHHIACDDISKRVIFADLSAMYAAAVAGRDAALPVPELQFADYAAWTHEHLDEDAVAGDTRWWRHTLDGAPALTTLHTDRPRPPVPSHRGSRSRSLLPADDLARLEATAREHGVTLYMAGLAAFAALLETYGRDGDVVVGSPFTGRHRAELRDVVGLFLTTLPVRIDTSGDPTFADLLARTRAAVVGVLQHQDLPFERLLDVLRPDRHPSHDPLFQTMFTLRGETATATMPRLGDVAVDPVGFDPGWVKFDLGVTCVRSGSGLDVFWQWTSDLFDRDTVERMSATLVDLLAAAARHPEATVSELVAAPPVPHAAFARQASAATRRPGDTVTTAVSRTPAAVALVADVDGDSVSWTSEQLDHRRARLSHELVARGVTPGDVVAVALDRTRDCLVAHLAAHAVGATVLPLDPGHPVGWNSGALRHAAAVALICDDRSDRIGRRGIARVHTDDPQLAARPTTAPPPVQATGAAYLLAHTGPDATPVTRSVSRTTLDDLVAWSAAGQGIGPVDRVLQLSPADTPAGVWELAVAAGTGAALVVAGAAAPHPAALVDLLARHRVTVVAVATTALPGLVDALDAAPAPDLRLVVAHGGGVPAPILERWRRQLSPGVRLDHLHDPGGADVVLLAATDLAAGGPARDSRLGDPLGGVRARVLDSSGRAVRIGVPGELHLVGPGDPADRAASGGTGELVRRLRDNGLEGGIGRVDDLVEARGTRVDRRAVETALAGLPGVAEAACDVRPDADGGAMLVGFVVARSDARIDAEDLREDLVAVLPFTEIPDVVVVVGSLPRTPAGTLDRSALPAPHPSAAREVVAPRDDVEARIARIWKRVLDLEIELSVFDDFFDVGGHSLAAVRMFPALEGEFRIKLPLALMIEGVTVDRLATVVRRELAGRGRDAAGAEEQLLATMREGDALPPLFAMPALRGDLLVYRQVVDHLAPGRAVYGIHPRGGDGWSLPRTSVVEIARDAVATMQRRQPHGPYHLLGYCFSAIVGWEVARQLTERGEQVAFLGIIDATPPREAVNATARGRWRRRMHALARGGPGGAVRLVEGYVMRRVRRHVARAYVRAGRRFPPGLITFAEAHEIALRTYAPEALPLPIVLVRRSPTPGAANPAGRWWDLAGGGVDEVLIDGDDVDHARIVQARYAAPVAAAIDAGLQRADAAWAHAFAAGTST